MLPRAVVPLVRYAPEARLMRSWRASAMPPLPAWLSAAGIILLNGALVWQVATGDGALPCEARRSFSPFLVSPFLFVN
ncbi:MAG TPA: hypothetical protein VGL08_03090 [Paraburkholderia sp.]|jgi:Mn2+/Fe2+ NRAMP family transporter